MKIYFSMEQFFVKKILSNNFGNVFFDGANVLKKFFEMHFLREQFFKKIFEMQFLMKQIFTKVFGNVFFEGDIFKKFFLKCSFSADNYKSKIFEKILILKILETTKIMFLLGGVILFIPLNC